MRKSDGPCLPYVTGAVIPWDNAWTLYRKGTCVELRIQPTTEADAREILSWQYDAPYDLYNPNSDWGEADVASFADPANGYLSLRDEHGHLIAYICFGAEARVPGGDYTADALDVGCGIKPNLTGHGLGPVIIG